MADSPIGSYQRQETTWYHLPAKITVTENHIHMVRLPGLTLPHPGVVNWIVRRGLPLQTRLELTACHELGHLQTLPVPLLHLLFLLWPRQGYPQGNRWLHLGVGLLAHQMAWEVAAESYVAVSDRRAYHSPRPARYQVLYAVFWVGITVFTLLSTLFILKRKKSD